MGSNGRAELNEMYWRLLQRTRKQSRVNRDTSEMLESALTSAKEEWEVCEV